MEGRMTDYSKATREGALYLLAAYLEARNPPGTWVIRYPQKNEESTTPIVSGAQSNSGTCQNTHRSSFNVIRVRDFIRDAWNKCIYYACFGAVGDHLHNGHAQIATDAERDEETCQKNKNRNKTMRWEKKKYFIALLRARYLCGCWQ